MHGLGLVDKLGRALRNSGQDVRVRGGRRRGRLGCNASGRLVDLDAALLKLLNVKLLEVSAGRNTRSRHAHVDGARTTAYWDFAVRLAFLFENGRR